MPLQSEEFRHGLGSRRADMARDQVEHEVVPRHGSPGSDELRSLAGHHQRALGKEGYLGKLRAERGRVAPVDGRIAAIEQPGFGEQEYSRACRAKVRAASVNLREPRDQLGIAAAPPPGGRQHHRGHDDYVGIGYLGDTALRLRGEAAGQPDRSGRRADDFDAERG